MASNPFDQFDAPDYDYDGARAAGVKQGPNGHWPDTYKLPNHITFSSDSKYSKPGQEGGTWSQADGKWHYKPSAFVLSQHSPEELKSYFSRNESDSVLDLPAQSSTNPFDQFDAPPAAQSPQQSPQQPGLLDRTVALASSHHPLLTGAAEMAAHAGTSMLATPLAGLAGIAGSLLPGPQGQGANAVEGVQSGLTYQPRSGGGRLLQKAGGLLPGLISKGADVAGQATADATGSPAAGAAVNTAIQMAPALLLRGRAGKMVENVNSRITAPARAARPAAPAQETAAAAERPAGLASLSKDAPTLDKLRTDKNAAYKRSEEAGVQLTEFSFKKLKGKILNELGERVNPTLHPDTTAALKDIMDTKGAVTLEKVDQLRQIANDAKGSVKPADQRLAARVVESIDEYLDGVSPKDITRGDPKGVAALKEARDLNTRLKKGEQLDELFRRAEIKAGANYTQSGMENALRSEFKALALDAKKLKRFTPEERAAITKVAKGAPLENALRFVGKFAPSGPIAAAVTTFLASSAGGPLGAAAVGGALGARYAATKMTVRNASRASELVRRGPNALAEQTPAAPRKVNALLEN